MANNLQSSASMTPVDVGPISPELRTKVLTATAETMVAVLNQYQAHSLTHDEVTKLLTQLGQLWSAFR